MTTITDLSQFLSTPRQVVITTHQRPDGDAIGSSLALFHYLKSKGHYPNVIAPTDYPEFLKWMPGNDAVIIYENETESSKKLVEKAEIFFCLDFNRFDRLDELGKHIQSSDAPKVLIDHHLEPATFAQYEFCSIKASSTSELVYDFIEQMGDKDLITKDIATCLYTGILTDTDRFRVPTTSPLVHRITADLLEKGINHTKIYEEVYETFGENRLRFFGYCIREKLEIIPELRTGIIALERSDMQRFSIGIGDTEGLVNYPLWIKEVTLSVLITQRPNESKLSFRSKGDFSAERIGREFYNGGGHKNAAGGISKLSVTETKEQLISILARFKNELNRQ